MAGIRLNLGVVTLAVVAIAMCSARTGQAAELWFEVTADTRIEQSLDPGGQVISVPDSTFQPVQFELRIAVDPVFRDATDTGAGASYRTIVSWFQGPHDVSATPFNAEMEACNTFALTGVGLSPWYHYSSASETWTFSTPPSGFVSAQVQYALSNTPSGGDNRMYVHALAVTAQNPTLAVPPGSVDEMAPWTQERFLAFISHADTVWRFAEKAWSQDGYLEGDVLVTTYYEGIAYTGTAQPVPAPAAMPLLVLGLGCLLRRRSRQAT